jgi:glycosyltransferase involved in cell wall biosynthesis
VRPVRVSVLMAVRDDAARAGRAVGSILTQSFQDLELLLVDDGSQDDTFSVLTDCAEGDDRIQLTRNRQPLGLAACLNRVAGVARGDFLARMDADDVALPARLETQLRFMDEHPEVDILGSAAYRVDLSDNVLGIMDVETSHARLVEQIYWRNPFIHPTVVMKRTAFFRVGGYDASFRRAQDYDLWLRAARMCCLANLESPLLRYCVDGSIAWGTLPFTSGAVTRAVKRDGRPRGYYWYSVRPYLGAGLLCGRRWVRRVVGR